MIKVGDYEVTTHNFGDFRLDGGAMFGSVPKNLWDKKIKSDDENCIAMSTRSLVLKSKDALILLDVGYGYKWNEKLRRIFAFEEKARSAPFGTAPFGTEQVTDVILTHLHFDHAGGISSVDKNGKLVPTYPNATIHLQLANLKNAQSPNLKEKASYLTENVSVVASSDLRLVQGTGEILPGIKVHEVDGHTVGQQWVEIFDEKTAIFFPTDLVPTSHHLLLPFQMGYDMCAATVMKEKEAFLKEAVNRKAIVVFQHDRDFEAGRIGTDAKGGYFVAEKTTI